MGTQVSIERKVGVTYKDDTMAEELILDGLRDTQLSIHRFQLRSITYVVANFGDNMWPLVNWMYRHLSFDDQGHRARISREKLQSLLDDATAVLADRSLAPRLFPLDDTDINFSGMDYESEDYWGCFPCIIGNVQHILSLCPSQEKLTVYIV